MIPETMNLTNEERMNAEAVIAERAAIGKEQILTAIDTLNQYKQGKANLDQRVITNEDWWKLQHWKTFKKKEETKGEWAEPTSAWLFNSIMNKHADAMDNYPEPTILPREQSDEGVSDTLSAILPVVFDNCNFEQTYSSAWWDKLKNGCAIYGIFWNSRLLNGLGDIDIRSIDILDMYWEPGITDIQKSKNLFVLSLADNKSLEMQYPQLKGKLTTKAVDKKEYHYDDTVNTDDKSVVIDWYYKINKGQGDIVHFVKFCNQELLFASENDPQYERGFYNHGKYPYVVDVLFEEKGTPSGFGYVDVMKSPQEYIDRLNGAIIDNALWASKPRWFGRDNASINEDEYLDLTHPIVHVAGQVNDENLKIIETPQLSGNYITVLQNKVEELKETSGNRDFSQGATSSGVTSGAAISALQEAGSKGSRDMIKGAYRAYSEICLQVIELIRQFYDEPRAFRITGNSGTPEYVTFNNNGLNGMQMNEFGIEFKTKEPVFDIKIKAQKSSPYARLSQNELALQFYNLGFFNPQMTDQALMCIDMMDFEGKDKIRDAIRQNGDLFSQLQMAQAQNMQMAQALAERGDPRVLQALQMANGESAPIPNGDLPKTDNTPAEKAKDRAIASTEAR